MGYQAPGGFPPGGAPGPPPGHPSGYPAPSYPPAGPPAGYPPAAQGGGHPPGAFGSPAGVERSGGRSVLSTVAAIVPVLGLITFVAWRYVLPGVMGGSAVAKRELKKDGIAYEAANPDDVIAAMQKRAKKWRADAVLYSVTIDGLKNDGTIDFSRDSSGMTVAFFSPKLVGSNEKSDRDKGMRKYVVNQTKVDEQVWAVKQRYTDVPGTPVPKCKSKAIGKILKDKGLKGTDTALVSLDPGFAFATDSLNYNVNVNDPELHFYLDIESCKILKEL